MASRLPLGTAAQEILYFSDWACCWACNRRCAFGCAWLEVRANELRVSFPLRVYFSEIEQLMTLRLGPSSGSLPFCPRSAEWSFYCASQAHSPTGKNRADSGHDPPSFLPETLRVLVGDGSIPPPRLNKALLPFIGRKQRRSRRDLDGVNLNLNSGPTTPSNKSLSNPFVLLTYPDVLTLLIFTGVFYAVYMSVASSISTLFKEAYPWLNQTQIGLCYLSVGSGMLASSVGTGRMLDWDYRRVR